MLALKYMADAKHALPDRGFTGGCLCRLVFANMTSMHWKFLFSLALLSLPACMAQPRILPQEDIGYSRTMLEGINLYRLENRLNPLRPDPILAGLARAHSAEMFRRQKQHHRNFDERLEQARSRLCVENVGWNYGSPQNLLYGWQESSDHNRNLLHEGLNRVGIAEIGAYVTFFACQ